MKSQLYRINHVLHTHLCNGDVSAMLRRTLVVVAVGIWIVFTACALLAWSLTARAQSPDCLGAALVQVIPGATLNVRTQSGGVGPILGTVNHASGELRATEEQAGFLRLSSGGWIVNKYLSISCWGFGTTAIPSATSTRTPQPTPTRTPQPATRTPLPTPTQIQHNFVWCSSEPDIRQVGDSWIVECKR